MAQAKHSKTITFPNSLRTESTIPTSTTTSTDTTSTTTITSSSDSDSASSDCPESSSPTSAAASAARTTLRRNKSADVLGVSTPVTLRPCSANPSMSRPDSCHTNLTSATAAGPRTHTLVDPKFNVIKVPQNRHPKPSSDCSPPPETLPAFLDERPMTAREKCMEQQRASLSVKPASSKSSMDSRISWFHDSQSTSSSGELTRSASVPSSRAPKAAMESRTSTISSKWTSYVSSLRQKGSSKHSHHQSVQHKQQYATAGVEQSLRKALVRRHLRTKPWSHHLETNLEVPDETTADEASTNETTSPSHHATTPNEADQKQKSTRDRRPTSLISYLHDPDKIKKFSLELESLVNSEFDKRWHDVEQDFFAQASSDPMSETATDPADNTCLKGLGIHTDVAHSETELSLKALKRNPSIDTLSIIDSELKQDADVSALAMVGGPKASLVSSPARYESTSPSGEPPSGPLPALPTKDIPLLAALALQPTHLDDSTDPVQQRDSRPTSSSTWRRSMSSSAASKGATEAARALAVRSALEIRSSSELSRPVRSKKALVQPDHSCTGTATASSTESSDSTITALPAVPLHTSQRKAVHGKLVRLTPSKTVVSRSSSEHTPSTTPSTTSTTSTATSATNTPAISAQQDSQPKKPRKRQTLSRSTIKIIVDTDPATGLFRAGGIAPAATVATGSPKTKRATKKKTVVRSQRKEITGSRASTKRPSVRHRSHSRSHDYEPASEDEVNPMLAPPYSNSNNSTRTVSLYKPRVNNDVTTDPISAKVGHLASEVVDIKSELKKQKDSIALMGAVVGFGGPSLPLPASKYKKDSSMGVVSSTRTLAPATATITYRDYKNNQVNDDPDYDLFPGYYSIDNNTAGTVMRPISFTSSTGSSSAGTGISRSTNFASAGSGGDGSLTDLSECSSDLLAPTKPLKKRMEQARNRASMREKAAAAAASTEAAEAPVVKLAGARTTAPRGMSHLSLRGEEWPWPAGALEQQQQLQQQLNDRQRDWTISVNIAATATTTSDVMDRHLEDMRGW